MESWRDLFSVVSASTGHWLNSWESCSAWNSLWRSSTSASWASKHTNILLLDDKILPKSLPYEEVALEEHSEWVFFVEGVTGFVVFPMMKLWKQSSM